MRTGEERRGEREAAGAEVGGAAAASAANLFQVTLVIVPPGGGEAEYSLQVAVPALPREGDYVTVMRRREGPVAGKHIGTEDFIVRRVWWAFDYADDGRLYEEPHDRIIGSVNGIGIECELAKGHYSSEAHRRACGAGARTFEASAY
ncbi:MAG TPA: hypothetical protein VF547_01285 [Allosphingosinicella sp.]|jgi:hypothetical protein